MKIRDDLYSDIPDSPGKEIFIETYFELTFLAFDRMFDSKDEIIEELNKVKSPKIVEKILETGHLYYLTKGYSCPNCHTSIEKCEKCSAEIEMPAFFVYGAIIGMIEFLSRGETKFKNFRDWMSKRKNRRHYQTILDEDKKSSLKNVIEQMKIDYDQIYGSTVNITGFFKRYLTVNEKVELIKSINFTASLPELPPIFPDFKEGMDYEKEMLAGEELQQRLTKYDNLNKFIADEGIPLKTSLYPLCIDQKNFEACYVRDQYNGRGVGYCHRNYHNCRLENDEKFRENILVKISKILYDWRSVYAHGERLPPISENIMLGAMYKDKPIVNDFTTKKMRVLFEEMVKRYIQNN